ncbi:hypothetical protein ACLOJK_027836 [Asimina triloba]
MCLSGPPRAADRWAPAVRRRQRSELRSKIDGLMMCDIDGQDDGLRRPDLWLGHAPDLHNLGGPTHDWTPAGAANERSVVGRDDGVDAVLHRWI